MDKQSPQIGYPINSRNVIGVPTLKYKCNTCSLESTVPSNHVAPKCGTCYTYMEFQPSPPTKKVTFSNPPSTTIKLPDGQEVVSTVDGNGLLVWKWSAMDGEEHETEIGGGPDSDYPVPKVNPCDTGHVYVNVGFNTIKMVCKHCDKEE